MAGLIFLAAMLLGLPLASLVFSLALYVIYRYGGGRLCFRSWRSLMGF